MNGADQESVARCKSIVREAVRSANERKLEWTERNVLVAALLAEGLYVKLFDAAEVARLCEGAPWLPLLHNAVAPGFRRVLVLVQSTGESAVADVAEVPEVTAPGGEA